jgi:hypothetical protein
MNCERCKKQDKEIDELIDFIVIMSSEYKCPFPMDCYEHDPCAMCELIAQLQHRIGHLNQPQQ